MSYIEDKESQWIDEIQTKNELRSVREPKQKLQGEKALVHLLEAVICIQHN